MSVSENSGTPKSSILIGFSNLNHPFWGTLIFGNTQVYLWENMDQTQRFLKTVGAWNGQKLGFKKQMKTDTLKKDPTAINPMVLNRNTLKKIEGNL